MTPSYMSLYLTRGIIILLSMLIAVDLALACDGIDCNWGFCLAQVGGGGYRCVCEEGYGGEHCDEPTRVTRGVPCECLNGGTCVSVDVEGEAPSTESGESSLDGEAGVGESPDIGEAGGEAGGEAVGEAGGEAGGEAVGEVACLCAPGFTGSDCSEIVEMECFITNCSKCVMQNTCGECQPGFFLSNNSTNCEPECLVRNCYSCASNQSICNKCSDGYQLEDYQCMQVVENECSVRDCSKCVVDQQNICQECRAGFILTKNNTCERECLVRNCSSCISNSRFCDQCNDGYMLEGKQCNAVRSADMNSRLDIKVPIIIGSSLLTVVAILAIVLIVSMLACHSQRKKKHKTKIDHELPRSDSAEMFNRIHSTFALPRETTGAGESKSEENEL